MKISILSNLSNNRGLSVIGTVFTLIVLGVLGASLVSIVAGDQESRMSSIFRERAFYGAQAGFEYALREIKEGGYPIVTEKAIGEGRFSVSIAPNDHKITVVGESGSAFKTYSITAPLLGMDCIELDVSNAQLGGPTQNQLIGLVLRKKCLNAVSIQSTTLSWVSDMAEKVRRVRIAGADVYQDVNGAASGSIIDNADFKVSNSANIDVIEFSSGMAGKTITIRLKCTDTSEILSPGLSF